MFSLGTSSRNSALWETKGENQGAETSTSFQVLVSAPWFSLHRNSALWEAKDCPAANFTIFFDQSGEDYAFYPLAGLKRANLAGF